MVIVYSAVSSAGFTMGERLSQMPSEKPGE